jgi:hypothetical protein
MPTYVVAETFRVMSYLFIVVEVLSLAGPEGFAANRTVDGYNRSVTEGTSRVRVVQNGYAQFPTVGIR